MGLTGQGIVRIGWMLRGRSPSHTDKESGYQQESQRNCESTTHASIARVPGGGGANDRIDAAMERRTIERKKEGSNNEEKRTDVTC